MKIAYGCRWEEALEYAIELLSGGKEILRVDYEANYQGYLDIDVLLNDGRVFSYKYYYGSCSGCDSWEGTEYDKYSYPEEDADSNYPDRLARLMIQEATLFDDIEQYNEWIKTLPKDDR